MAVARHLVLGTLSIAGIKDRRWCTLFCHLTKTQNPRAPHHNLHVAPLVEFEIGCGGTSHTKRDSHGAAMCVSRTCAVACALMLVGANAFVVGPRLLPRGKGGLSAATAGATRRPAGSLAMVRGRERESCSSCCTAWAVGHRNSRSGIFSRFAWWVYLLTLGVLLGAAGAVASETCVLCTRPAAARVLRVTRAVFSLLVLYHCGR